MGKPEDAADRPPSRAPSLRVSDSEREACVAELSTAAAEGRLTLEEFSERMHAAYAARTEVQLSALLRDLPARTGGRSADSRPRPDGASVVTGRPGTGASVAVMSGVERAGSWSCSRVHRAVAVMGGVELDFRRAELESAETEVMAVAVMGGVAIVVPEGWNVRVDGFAVMGGNDEKVRRDRFVPGAPSLHVRAYALMGGVSVESRDASGASPSRKELRESRRQIEG
jgi:hypothetical protein